MKKTTVDMVCMLLCVLLFAVGIYGQNYNPEQIHISLTGKETKTHSVVYTTGSSTNSDPSIYTEIPTSNVWYGTDRNSLHLHSQGESKRYQHHNYTADIHYIIFDDLQPNTLYYYRVGDLNYGLSEVLTFNTKPIDTWAVFGDFGVEGFNRTYPMLYENAIHDTFQGIIHFGDIAYDLHTDNGTIGDTFLRNFQPVIAHRPYLTTVGNHEKSGNFTHYKHRFPNTKTLGKQSGSDSWLYSSLNQGLIHFVFIDTEIWLIENNEEQQQMQLKWLEDDLQKANKKKHRQEQPWIVSIAHKCDWHDKVDYSILRTLLHNYGVDLHLCGHQHNYQRLWPSYTDQNIEKQQHQLNMYIAPQHLTQVVIGGTSQEISSHITLWKDALAVSLFTFGYGMLKAYNDTHIRLTFIETTKADINDFGDDLLLPQYLNLLRQNLQYSLHPDVMKYNTNFNVHDDIQRDGIHDPLLIETQRLQFQLGLTTTILDDFWIFQPDHGTRQPIDPNTALCSELTLQQTLLHHSKLYNSINYHNLLTSSAKHANLGMVSNHDNATKKRKQLQITPQRDNITNQQQKLNNIIKNFVIENEQNINKYQLELKDIIEAQIITADSAHNNYLLNNQDFMTNNNLGVNMFADERYIFYNYQDQQGKLHQYVFPKYTQHVDDSEHIDLEVFHP